MKNITLTVEDELYEQSRVVAAQREETVTGLWRGQVVAALFVFSPAGVYTVALPRCRATFCAIPDSLLRRGHPGGGQGAGRMDCLFGGYESWSGVRRSEGDQSISWFVSGAVF